jgi:hypothetical protein
MANRVVAHWLELRIELTLPIEASAPVKDFAFAVNGDLQLVSACDYRDTHARREPRAELACETLAKRDFDGAAENAALSMQALKQRMKLGEALAKPLFDKRAHLAFWRLTFDMRGGARLAG